MSGRDHGDALNGADSGAEQSAELRALLDFVADIGAAQSLPVFAKAVARGLRSLMSGVVARYEDNDPNRDLALCVSDPRSSPPQDGLHAMSLRLGAPRGPITIVTVTRDRPFSAAEEAVMRMLRPHLVAAHRNVWLRHEAEALREGMAASGQAFVLAVPGGGIMDASEDALDTLQRYFPEAEMPELVADIVDPTRRPCAQKDAEQGEIVGQAALGRLEIRVLPAPYPAPCMVLLAEQDAVEAVMPFAEHGLTSREIEVATLVAGGSTNGEVAKMLFVSPHTVKKHLEHVYAKLGVRTRTELTGEIYRTGLLSGTG